MAKISKDFKPEARSFAEDRRDWMRLVIGNGDIPQNYRLVGVAVALRMNHATEDSFPALKTIADDASVGLRTAIRAVQFLEEKGYLRIKRKRRAGNRYEMVLPWE